MIRSPACSVAEKSHKTTKDGNRPHAESTEKHCIPGPETDMERRIMIAQIDTVGDMATRAAHP
jgi:hypothetical protein